MSRTPRSIGERVPHKAGRRSTDPERRTRAHQIGIHELHRRTGISVSHISKIFNSGPLHRRPSLGLAKTLASAMSLSLDDLFAEIRRVEGEEGAA
jgi:transcriptional regulator with XRE-family HTH domain